MECDLLPPMIIVFFFNDSATTEIYTLSLHDALPTSLADAGVAAPSRASPPPLPEDPRRRGSSGSGGGEARERPEEQTSELQSPDHIVCRLLLDKKNIARTFSDSRKTSNPSPHSGYSD